MRSSIPRACVNLLVLKRFKAIISESYTKLKEETILGSLLVPTTDENVGATNHDIGVKQIGQNKGKKRLCARISLKVKTYGHSSLINQSSMRYETIQVL